jgi:hypothetical protein
MTRPVPLSLLLAMLASILPAGLLSQSVADAQPATAAASLTPISDAIKQSSVPDLDQITQNLTPAVQLLTGDDPAGQAAGRDYIDHNVSPGSKAYHEAYGKTVSTLLIAALKDAKTSQRAKVNIGLIAIKTTEGAGDTSLSPLIIELLGDKSDAVALMGMKAARVAVPLMVAQTPKLKPDDPLLTAIVDCVTAHPQPPVGGPIAEEAYNAMYETRAKPMPAGVATAIVPTVLKLQQSRINLYIAGVPESPEADSYGSLLVTDTGVWSTLPANVKFDVMQTTSDMIGLASQRAAQKNTDGLTMLLQYQGQVLVSLSNPPNGPLNDVNLAQAAQQLQGIRIGTPGQNITMSAKVVFDAIKAESAFAKITPFKSIASAAAVSGG